MFINSADDFINPPEMGIAEREIKKVKQGRFVLLPASEQTHGHGTHTLGRRLAAVSEATARGIPALTGATRRFSIHHFLKITNTAATIRANPTM